MDSFKLDTSGDVRGVPLIRSDGTISDAAFSAFRFDELDPFTQGYIEALFASIPASAATFEGFKARGYKPAAFSDLAPETIERIKEDCAACIKGRIALQTAAGGANFWEIRQAGRIPKWPPLTVYLSDDGKVRFQ